MIVGCQPDIFWHQTKPSLGPFKDFTVVEIVLIILCCAFIDMFFICFLPTTSQLALVRYVVHEESTEGQGGNKAVQPAWRQQC